MISRIRIIIVLLIMYSCSGHTPDGRLARVAGIVSDSPEEALAALDSINRDSLTEADRHFHDLLTIKARDKAYITHTSDSLILDVIDYESNHKENGRLAEALYYGGRVYSDLGDYPTSLHYFQESLDLLPADTEDKDLRDRVLSQAGRLLLTLSLFDEAAQYIRDAVEINRSLKDTTNLIHNLQLLGITYVRGGDFPQAEKYLRESLDLSKGRPSYHAAKSRLYIAAAKYRAGDIDSALLYIRNTPEMVNPFSRNFALAYGAHIYHNAGIPDTAYMYARDLVMNEDPQQKEVAYEVLLAPELRSYLDDGDLDRYVSDYRTLLVDYYDENQNQLAINQQSLYNYQLHERDKADAERKVSLLRNSIIFGVMAFMLITVILALISLYLKNKSKKNIIELQHALSHIERLRYELNIADLRRTLPPDSTDDDGTTDEKTEDTGRNRRGVTGKTEDELRDHLRSGLMALYERSDERASVSQVILNSDAYKSLQEYIQEGQAIGPDDPLWSEIETAVLASSPKFRTNLNLLTAGNLTTIDLHTALLIKCGIRPSKMGILLGRSNGAIVSRRETLSMKILGGNKGTKVIDAIIRLL